MDQLGVLEAGEFLIEIGILGKKKMPMMDIPTGRRLDPVREKGMRGMTCGGIILDCPWIGS